MISKRYKSINIDTALQHILQIFELLDVTGQMTKLAIKRSWPDIEDAVQHECAIFHNSNCIITRNKTDFLNSEIPVFTPDEWVVEFRI